MRVRQRLTIAFLGLLVAGLLAWGFWPRAVMVEALAVSRALLTLTVEEEGRTRVIDRYVIAAPVEGMACRVDLDVGDAIAQGETLLGITPLAPQVLDPRRRAQAQADVAAAEAALAAARAEAEAAATAANLAGRELERLRPLLDQGLVSRTAFDQAETEARATAAAQRSADFRVEVARYEREAARTALEYTAAGGGPPAERVPVRSPIDGRVLAVIHECEGPVRTGEPLLEVGDPSTLEIEVDVLSADAVRIRPGMRVILDRWGGETPLEGVVRRIEPVGFTKVSALGVEEQRVLVISDFVSPPKSWERLGDGYRVEASFVLWHGENVLQVPASSLFRHGDDWAVFVIEKGRARVRPVEVGRRSGLRAQILAGLEAGEQIINHPSDEIEDGRRVAAKASLAARRRPAAADRGRPAPLAATP